MTDDHVRTTERDGASIVKPSGDVDMSRSPSLREAIKQATGSASDRVVVDLSDVGYMDSSGLATLVEAMKLTRTSSRRLVLCAMNDRVRAIFEIAKLDQYFTITDSLDEAMNA